MIGFKRAPIVFAVLGGDCVSPRIIGVEAMRTLRRLCGSKGKRKTQLLALVPESPTLMCSNWRIRCVLQHGYRTLIGGSAADADAKNRLTLNKGSDRTTCCLQTIPQHRVRVMQPDSDRGSGQTQCPEQRLRQEHIHCSYQRKLYL